MPFDIAENGGRTLWVPMDSSSTYYKGQIVTLIAASKAMTIAVTPLAVPAGAVDLTNFQIPFGIVTGFNRRTPQSTTVGSMSLEYEAGIITQAAQLAREWAMAESMYSKGDPQPLIQITEITPNTILRGPICNAALGTGPTVVTSTVADTTGWTTAGTTGACDFTPVASVCTAYCRTGANAGLYRVTNDTSTTAPDATVAFPYDVAIGDTFVRVPIKQGFSYAYIAGPGLYIDCGSNYGTTNYFVIFVYKLDLSEAGKEIAEFRFSTEHFTFRRAAS